MAFVVETGAGIANANAYAAVETVSAYWSDRGHDPLAATWAAATTANKQGAIVEASTYLDATYGTNYLGQRRGWVQGLLWPRTGAKDGDGYLLPDLPQPLIVATSELAARALSARLLPDADRGNQIVEKFEKLGPLEERTRYAETASTMTRYGAIDGIMAPIVDNPLGGAASWNWR